MKKIFDRMLRTKMRTQLVLMYIISVLIPLLIIGSIISRNNIGNLRRYNDEMTEAVNDRTRSIFYEISTQIYNVSEEISTDEKIVTALSQHYDSPEEFKNAIDDIKSFKTIRQTNPAISSISIYSNQVNSIDYGDFHRMTIEIRAEQWCKEACEHYGANWYVIEKIDNKGNENMQAALVRKIPLYFSDDEILLVISLDYNYLWNKVHDSGYEMLMSFDDGRIFLSNYRQETGKKLLTNEINRTATGKKTGSFSYNGKSYLTRLDFSHLNKSDTLLYVATMNKNAYSDIEYIQKMSGLLTAMAILLPALLMSFFIVNFSRQVNGIRKEISKASLGNYDMLEKFNGCYELSEAYRDLKFMIAMIQEKDEKMFAAELEEQKLQNEQQKMEFQMLASQINPHFLYNTLEMIRMKAIAAKDTETATAIKLLGKSMRYVLDNTGVEYTTLAKEISHIETYLQIQHLRFGERVNYEFFYEDGINPEKIKILPLLLQPIVENAILHGLEEVEEGGMIKISVSRKVANSDILYIDISDNGCGMSEKDLAAMRRRIKKGKNTTTKKYGIGLVNIDKRIKLCYGNLCGLVIESEEGKGTTVTATIREI